MKHTNMKRYLGTEQQVEKPATKLPSANQCEEKEQVLDLKKMHKAEEFRLSHPPAQPIYDRPDCCNVSQRFGKKAGST